MSTKKLIIFNNFCILLDNVAHGCLHGVFLWPGDETKECVYIRNFVIYKTWDYGIYHQTPSSVILENNVIADFQVITLHGLYLYA